MTALRRASAWLGAAFLGAAVLASWGCGPGREPRLSVVATTTLVGSLVQEIGGGTVEVRVLTPPGSCPGHYDIRPGDARAVARSGLLFAHGYEEYLPRLVEAADNPKLRRCVVAVEGDWLVPQVQDSAALKAARLLAEADPANREIYDRRLQQYRKRIEAAGAAVKNTLDLAGAKGVVALASDQQAPLLRWMGLVVAGTYGRPEELTPTALHRLVEIAKQRKVRLVVDNLQSGPEAGKELAREIGAAHATLSNFPGGFPNTGGWEKCLRDDARRVVEALQRRRPRGGGDGLRG